jgi:hypothetical protein
MHARRRLFLIIVASVEASVGLALLILPSIPLALLLGLEPVAAEALFVSRIAGAALLAIGIASWTARAGELNPSLFGLLIGILIYNIAVAILLVYASVALNMTGGLLWPTAAFHGILAGWGSLLLRAFPMNSAQKP